MSLLSLLLVRVLKYSCHGWRRPEHSMTTEWQWTEGPLQCGGKEGSAKSLHLSELCLLSVDAQLAGLLGD